VHWPSGALASRTDVAVETCAAQVSFVVGLPTDGVRWQPLAVGFASRYATPAQRRALAVRDGSGCAHPGCTVPGWRCVAHHITPWDEGGPSDLPNLVLLCRYHHREVHRGRLRIVFHHGHATTQRTDRAPP
jgi:5-methylcytosine-specific restriction protein A